MKSGKPSAKLWRIFPLVILSVSAGCSHSGDPDAREKAYTSGVTPHAPAFFTGPASVLLTNAGGFSAWVTVETESLNERERNFSGHLLGRGSKLVFAPDTDQAASKHQRIGGFSFLWDVGENRGYVLSEALQAYAPVSSSLRVTNVALALLQTAPQKVSGHVCESMRATLDKTDGTAATFEVLKAADLNGFPVRITSETNSPRLTLTFSKIRLEVPAPDVFVPPDGFNKYTSAEAMIDELAARQRNLRRKSNGSLEPYGGYSGH